METDCGIFDNKIRLVGQLLLYTEFASHKLLHAYDKSKNC